jgi:hypothetical protein
LLALSLELAWWREKLYVGLAPDNRKEVLYPESERRTEGRVAHRVDLAPEKSVGKLEVSFSSKRASLLRSG